MGGVRTAISAAHQRFDYAVRVTWTRQGKAKRLGVAMNDLLYIGLTIVIFLLLALLVKGVEHFER
jgi:hypothetical protein